MKKDKIIYSWFSLLSYGVICSIQILPSAVNAIEFPGVTEREPPKSSAAGGRRGACVSGEIPIKALTPGDDNHVKTASAEPQLIVYLPKTKSKFAQFFLKEEGGDELDFQEIAIDEGDYFIKIELPEIETNQKYQWELSLICTPQYINSGNFIKGSIERVTIDSEMAEKISQSQDVVTKAEIYASQGIWSETLTLISSIRETQPQQWEELLSSVGLQDYASKSFNKLNSQSSDEAENEE